MKQSIWRCWLRHALVNRKQDLLRWKHAETILNCGVHKVFQTSVVRRHYAKPARITYNFRIPNLIKNSTIPCVWTSYYQARKIIWKQKTRIHFISGIPRCWLLPKAIAAVGGRPWAGRTVFVRDFPFPLHRGGNFPFWKDPFQIQLLEALKFTYSESAESLKIPSLKLT